MWIVRIEASLWAIATAIPSFTQPLFGIIRLRFLRGETAATLQLAFNTVVDSISRVTLCCSGTMEAMEMAAAAAAEAVYGFLDSRPMLCSGHVYIHRRW
ncbi:hypothetical protein SAY86_013048 [Trapa natans]|uniref:Uncharacterized protein n=1 Tax=Trapa natans TaxID=22666 RepID=A0AAN7LYX7_TRANT|nr:hypothetical protein SAY86_013048 [Trapa natans]